MHARTHTHTHTYTHSHTHTLSLGTHAFGTHAHIHTQTQTHTDTGMYIFGRESAFFACVRLCVPRARMHRRVHVACLRAPRPTPRARPPRTRRRTCQASRRGRSAGLSLLCLFVCFLFFVWGFGGWKVVESGFGCVCVCVCVCWLSGLCMLADLLSLLVGCLVCGGWSIDWLLVSFVIWFFVCLFVSLLCSLVACLVCLV